MPQYITYKKLLLKEFPKEGLHSGHIEFVKVKAKPVFELAILSTQSANLKLV